jgi:hypothetical protein
MNVHEAPIDGYTYKCYAGRPSFTFFDFPLDVAVERGDYVRFTAYDRHDWPPFHAVVSSIVRHKKMGGERLSMVMLHPEHASLRQVVFVTPDGVTSVVWVGTRPDLKERAIVSLDNGQTLRVHTLCVQLRPEDVPEDALVLGIEEVEETC